MSDVLASRHLCGSRLGGLDWPVGAFDIFLSWVATKATYLI